MRNTFHSITCVLILCAAALAAPSASKPKIGMAKATAIAEQHAHGSIKSKELEKEKGRWIYSFEFRQPGGKIREVNIDAYSGKVIGIEREDAKKESKEERSEGKKKH